MLSPNVAKHESLQVDLYESSTIKENFLHASVYVLHFEAKKLPYYNFVKI